MKKSCITLAIFAASGWGHAQSSVTLFGNIDMAISQVKGSESARRGVSNSGANVSQFGFRGMEDLGDQLKAGFWLEAGIDADTGTGKSNGALSFNRRSTVSLMGEWGEVCLGRDNSPTFLNHLAFDPFITNGVAGGMGFVMRPGAPVIQLSNTAGYFLPTDLAGFYGQLQYGFGEQASTSVDKNKGNTVAVRAGYQPSSSSLHVSAAFTEIKSLSKDNENLKISNIGALYNFGFIRPSVLWAQEQLGAYKVSGLLLGMTMPIKPSHHIRASIGAYNTAQSTDDWTKYSIGYTYDLSKRTRLYTSFAYLNNKDGAKRTVVVSGLGGVSTGLGEKSTGVDLGIRHNF